MESLWLHQYVETVLIEKRTWYIAIFEGRGVLVRFFPRSCTAFLHEINARIEVHYHISDPNSTRLSMSIPTCSLIILTLIHHTCPSKRA